MLPHVLNHYHHADSTYDKKQALKRKALLCWQYMLSATFCLQARLFQATSDPIFKQHSQLLCLMLIKMELPG